MSSLLDLIDSHVFGEIIESLHPRFGGKEVMDMRIKVLTAFMPADPANEDTKRHQEILDDTEALWPCAITPDPKAAEEAFKLFPNGQPPFLNRINEVVLPSSNTDEAAEWVMKTFTDPDSIICLSVGDTISTEVFKRFLTQFNHLEFLLAFPQKLSEVVTLLPDTLVEVKIPCTNGEAATHVPMLAEVLRRANRADSIDVVAPPKPENWLKEITAGLAGEGFNVELVETDLKALYTINVIQNS